MKNWMKWLKKVFDRDPEKKAALTEKPDSTGSKIKVVVVANCQGRPLAKTIKSLNPAIEVTAVAIVHLLRSEQYVEYRKAFEEADLIISQLVFDTYPCDFVQTNFLKSKYGDKVISIVNLYFTGYTPDWFYIRIPGAGPLRGPMGDYHNRVILESWQQGQDESIAVERLESIEYNKKFLPEIENSLQQLKEREKLVDVPITDFIEENFRKSRLFFTFNHPAMFLLTEYARRVLIKAGIAVKGDPASCNHRELLNKFIPLINPAVGLPSGSEIDDKHAGVKFSVDKDNFVSIGSKKLYKTHEIVTGFYQIYNQLGEQLALNEFGKRGK
jgi:hypothetical protein